MQTVSEENVKSHFSLLFTDLRMKMIRFAQGSRCYNFISSALYLSLTVTLNQENEKSLAELFA